MNKSVRVIVVGLVFVVAAGCATRSAIKKGYQASMKGDWDAAVAFYREALTHDPNRIDVKVALERAMRTASGEHRRRARELESQDQLPGAIAEYRKLKELDEGWASRLKLFLDAAHVDVMEKPDPKAAKRIA